MTIIDRAVLRDSVPERGNNRFQRKAANAMDKARRFIAALPLAATLIAGCSENRDECRRYNATTIQINRETDGKAPGVRELVKIPPGTFLSEPEIDFINEAQALSTEGMPKDVKVTQVPSRCPLHPGSAYTIPESGDGDRGVYVPEGSGLDSLSLIDMLAHEIGHLQTGNPPSGAEVISQLNEYEHELAGFALLSNQDADSGELIRWAVSEVHPSLYRRLVLSLESKKGQPGYDPLDQYDKANMFIYLKLNELNGDFLALRKEVRLLVDSNALEAALDEAGKTFLAAHSDPPAADLFIAIRTQRLNELQRRFGYGMALSYFQSDSSLIDAGLVFGLDGMNCAHTAQQLSETYESCSGGVCGAIGADESQAVDYSLCCIGADADSDGNLVFSKWSVTANGTEYKKNGGHLSYYGFDWNTATYLTPTKTQLNPDEPCR